MSDRFQVIPAAYLLLTDDQGRVLLTHRRGSYMSDHWACGAAGHVEAGESVLDAAVREAREELGVEIDPADLEPLTAMHRTAGNGLAIDERVDFFFRVRRWAGEPTRMEPDRSAGIAWFALDALPDPVVPHELEVFERLRQGTLPPVLAYGF